jgi:hypothetical protein
MQLQVRSPNLLSTHVPSECSCTPFYSIFSLLLTKIWQWYLSILASDNLRLTITLLYRLKLLKFHLNSFIRGIFRVQLSRFCK